MNAPSFDSVDLNAAAKRLHAMGWSVDQIIASLDVVNSSSRERVPLSRIKAIAELVCMPLRKSSAGELNGRQAPRDWTARVRSDFLESVEAMPAFGERETLVKDVGAILKLSDDRKYFRWRIPDCVFCALRHTHGGGRVGEDDPRRQLGSRCVHCMNLPWGRNYVYVLKDLNPERTSKMLQELGYAVGDVI
jgi:hypothetical protein